MQAKMGGVMDEMKSLAPYMAAGGLAGGVGGILQGRRVDDLRNRVSTLQGEQDGSFGRAVELANTQIQLAGAERAKQHPVRAAISGALGGMTTGAAVGSAVPKIVPEAQRLGRNIQTAFGR
jgi:hypothetical protein